jgi:lysophospholipase L1-like esterase
MLGKLSKLAIYSFLLNILLLLTGIFVVAKRCLFQYSLNHPPALPSYWDNPQYSEQLNIEPAYIRPDKIIMLGTSHVYKAHWDELLGRSDIGNRGIGSDITEGYLHRLQFVLDSHPLICFIEGGGNDIAMHIPADTIISKLGKLVDTLRTAHIIPVLHTIFYVGADYPRSAWVNDQITVVNKKILEFAAGRNVEYIDMNPTFAPADVLLPRYSQPDGIHLNAHAYFCWKDEIEKVLKTHNI